MRHYWRSGHDDGTRPFGIVDSMPQRACSGLPTMTRSKPPMTRSNSPMAKVASHWQSCLQIYLTKNTTAHTLRPPNALDEKIPTLANSISCSKGNLYYLSIDLYGPSRVKKSQHSYMRLPNLVSGTDSVAKLWRENNHDAVLDPWNVEI